MCTDYAIKVLKELSEIIKNMPKKDNKRSR